MQESNFSYRFSSDESEDSSPINTAHTNQALILQPKVKQQALNFKANKTITATVSRAEKDISFETDLEGQQLKVPPITLLQQVVTKVELHDTTRGKTDGQRT
jgi:hypothetical protein